MGKLRESVAGFAEAATLARPDRGQTTSLEVAAEDVSGERGKPRGRGSFGSEVNCGRVFRRCKISSVVRENLRSQRRPSGDCGLVVIWE